MTPQPATYAVAATSREVVGKQVRQLRNQGLLPAVVYGHNQKSVNVVIPEREFIKIYMEAGSSSLIDLKIDGGASQKVLIQDLQVKPSTRKPLHVDFYLVNMKEKLQTEIPLEFVGTSTAVEVDGGTLITVKSELLVECLPQDLVPHIEVDISSLATFDDVIRVKDIVVPTGIELLDDEEETVVSVTEPRSEAEMAELDEAPEATLEVESETGNEPAPDAGDKKDEE